MMYQQFFGFKEPPFNLTPDSKFLFLSHRHQEALAAMLFGVQERKGFICLTGEIGCGKTTLCRALLSQLDPEQVKVCMVLNSYLTDLELLKTINEGFGLLAGSDSKKTLLDALNNYLVDEFAKGHNVVLVIDESQNLRPETLEQVRMISNLETETDKLIQIMLIGQPELRRTLALPELEQLNQRITVRYHIQPLEEREIGDYIKHRLSVAEPQVEITFTPQAFRMAHHYSRGVPRRINVICDRCLLIAYTQGTFMIDDKIVQQAVDEVRGETLGTSGPITGGLGLGERGGAGARRAAWALAWMAAIACVIAGGIYLGTLMTSAFLGAGATPAKQVAAAVSRPTPPPAQNVIEKMKAPARKAAATPPAPTLTPTPAPTPVLYENWRLDADKTLRVREDRFSEAASYVNLMQLWGIEIDLSIFRDAPPDQVADYAMLPMVQAAPLNFQAYETDQLSEALRADLPVLVQLVGSDQFASWALITSMGGEMLTVVDPIHGKRSVRRSQLERLAHKEIVLYKDSVGLAGIKPGEHSERVRILQSWLAREGCYQGVIDGKFGDGVNEALEKLQQKAGLEPTGTLNAATLAYACARLNPRRPSLYT